MLRVLLLMKTWLLWMHLLLLTVLFFFIPVRLLLCIDQLFKLPIAIRYLSLSLKNLLLLHQLVCFLQIYNMLSLGLFKLVAWILLIRMLLCGRIWMHWASSSVIHLSTIFFQKGTKILVCRILHTIVISRLVRVLRLKQVLLLLFGSSEWLLSRVTARTSISLHVFVYSFLFKIIWNN